MSDKCIGRPSGRKKTAKVEVLLEPEVKKEFMEILVKEGKTASAEICNWVRDYIKEYKKNEVR